MFTDVFKTWKVEMHNLPTIGNGAARVVNVVFVFYVPKEEKKEVVRREKERKDMKT